MQVAVGGAQGCSSVGAAELSHFDVFPTPAMLLQVENRYGESISVQDIDGSQPKVLKPVPSGTWHPGMTESGQVQSDEGVPLEMVREMSIMLSMRHPNIVRVHEVVLDPSQMFMVMELGWMPCQPPCR